MVEVHNARVSTSQLWLQLAGLAFVLGGAALSTALRVLWIGIVADAVALAFAVAHTRWRRIDEGTVTADAEGLHIGGRLAVPSRRVKRAFVAEKNGRFVLHLYTSAVTNTRVEVATEEEARELLGAMNVDASRRATRLLVNWGSPRMQWKLAASLVVGTVAMFGAATLLAVFATPTAVFALLPPFFLALGVLGARSIGRITVGADGVYLTRGLAAARFLPYSAIREARTEGVTLVIETTSGPPVMVHRGTGLPRAERVLDSDAAAHMQTLARLIETGRQHAGNKIPAEILLARAGRDAKTWLRALRGADDEHAGFRDAALAVDTLWRIAEDPGAAATARAGAAVALRSRVDATDLARLRVAAETCAAPTLRVALTAAAADDESGLEDALGRLDDAAPARRAVRHE